MKSDWLGCLGNLVEPVAEDCGELLVLLGLVGVEHGEAIEVEEGAEQSPELRSCLEAGNGQQTEEDGCSKFLRGKRLDQMSDDELRPSACPMVSRVPSSLQRLHALSNLYAWLRLNLTLPDNLASAKRTLVRKKLLSCCGRGARLFLHRHSEPVNVGNRFF